MVKRIFHQYAAKRAAAWLALFSILLILVAPLISVSLQHDSMNAMAGMHHEMSMPMPDHHQMSHAQMRHHEIPSQSMPLDHAQACGYCVLLAHVPGLIFLVAMLLLGRVLRLRLAPGRQKVLHWHFFPWLWPDTRAPPCVCFF